MRTIKGNPFIGFYITGVASRIPSLPYLCVKIQFELGKNTSLNDYASIGGKVNTTTIPMRKTIDKFIIDLMATSTLESLMRVLSSEQLERDARKYFGVYRMIADRLSTYDKEDRDSDGIPTLPVDISSSDSSDDDSDNDKPSRKRPRQITSAGEDEKKKKMTKKSSHPKRQGREPKPEMPLLSQVCISGVLPRFLGWA